MEICNSCHHKLFPQGRDTVKLCDCIRTSNTARYKGNLNHLCTIRIADLNRRSESYSSFDSLRAGKQRNRPVLADLTELSEPTWSKFHILARSELSRHSLHDFYAQVAL